MSEIIYVNEIPYKKNENYNSTFNLHYLNHLVNTNMVTEEVIFRKLKEYIVVEKVVKEIFDNCELYKGFIIKTDEDYKFEIEDVVFFLDRDIRSYNSESGRAIVESSRASSSIDETAKRFKHYHKQNNK